MTQTESGSQQLRPHRGTTILVLGILGLVICPILGIIAWVMGNGDLKQIESGAMDPEGRGLTKAGKICGMIATILMILVIVIWILLIVLGVGAAAVGAGG